MNSHRVHHEAISAGIDAYRGELDDEGQHPDDALRIGMGVAIERALVSQGAVEENERLRGLLALWLEVAHPDTPHVVLGPDDESLGDRTRAALGGQ